jgi:hypothetical protein
MNRQLGRTTWARRPFLHKCSSRKSAVHGSVLQTRLPSAARARGGLARIARAYARGNLVFHLCQDMRMKTIWQRRARSRSPLLTARRSQRARCAACGSTGTRASLPDVWLLSTNWVHHWHAQRFARRACAAQSRPRVACAARLHSKRANLRGPPLD